MDDPKKMQARLEYLEGVNRSSLLALDMIRDIGGIHEPVHRLEEPGIILEICRRQVKNLVPVKTVAFYLVDEGTSEFKLTACTPAGDRSGVETEMELFIKDGTFSRAVLEKTLVTAAARDFSAHFIFHVLATRSRVRGMCVAVLAQDRRKVPDAALELLSILMTHCANALESLALYSQLTAANEMLKEKVEQLSRSQSYLRNEVAAHKQTLEALGKSEAQYRLLAETAREIIMTVSKTGEIIYANPYCMALGKYGNSDLVSMAVSQVLEGIDSLDLKFPQGASRVQGASLVVKGGGRVPLEISIVPIAAENRGALLITGRDVSEHLRAEAEKKRLEERLWQARKMESIGLLAGGTAHDFNNMLGIIFNYTDLSIECLPEGHPAVSYLGHVETASNQARDLARQLYAIGREDRHETILIDVNREMKQLMKLLRSSLGRKLTLACTLAPNPLMVRAESTRIRQIFMNLISNAAHAAKEGGICIGGEHVEVEPGPFQMELGVEPGSYVRFWVKDQGPGIDPDTLPHIFEPYYSTKKEEGSAGLGLAVVHGIVKNYGGAVDVETGPDKGACFSVYLPGAS